MPSSTETYFFLFFFLFFHISSIKRNVFCFENRIRKIKKQYLRTSYIFLFLQQSEFRSVISWGFDFTNWLTMDFLRGFIFVNLSFINVSYILIFSWFVLPLVGCEPHSSYPNFPIFLIALFGYKRLVLDWISTRRSKGTDVTERFTFFFLGSLYQQYTFLL